MEFAANMSPAQRCSAYLLLCALCAPLLVAAANNSTLVFRSTGLAQALVIPTIATIAVSGNHADVLRRAQSSNASSSTQLFVTSGQINLTSATWPVGGVTIATGRQVAVFAGGSVVPACSEFH